MVSYVVGPNEKLEATKETSGLEISYHIPYLELLKRFSKRSEYHSLFYIYILLPSSESNKESSICSSSHVHIFLSVSRSTYFPFLSAGKLAVLLSSYTFPSLTAPPVSLALLPGCVLSSYCSGRPRRLPAGIHIYVLGTLVTQPTQESASCLYVSLTHSPLRNKPTSESSASGYLLPLPKHKVRGRGVRGRRAM